VGGESCILGVWVVLKIAFGVVVDRGQALLWMQLDP
jgi:hypothetical protein